MRTVIQRVARARVTVEGRTVGEIGRGLLALVGCEARDTEKDAAWTAEKIAHLRVFEDPAGKMNLSVHDLADPDRGILLVPNFTVAGDAQKGRRPSFDHAMRPELASPLFDRVAQLTAAQGVRVATGTFRAHMLVDLVNDGPVTLIITSPV